MFFCQIFQFLDIYIPWTQILAQASPSLPMLLALKCVSGCSMRKSCTVLQRGARSKPQHDPGLENWWGPSPANRTSFKKMSDFARGFCRGPSGRARPPSSARGRTGRGGGLRVRVVSPIFNTPRSKFEGFQNRPQILIATFFDGMISCAHPFSHTGLCKSKLDKITFIQGYLHWKKCRKPSFFGE